MVSIANVVGSGSLNVELDVEQLGADLDVPYTEYDPENYHGLYVRLVEGGPLITVYRSGKYIISGCSTFEELEDTNEKFLEHLIEFGIIDSDLDPGFTVQNVVCTADLGHSVNLNALAIGLGLEAVEYEPEQFPGLVYRPPEFPTVLLLFANGKVVVTGSPDIQTAEDAFSNLESQIDDLLE
ncbi:TATA-box-binding protein [Natrinema salsiterrestre]|uniref:TATA-box-binding protein n=1 Tax=Natrinema salsiterrestre TaxID=2950540 RepID=A0A9Q4KXD0_9EURY|nr:TATA-box-binding protein [Natrinema salsiterrestre]MDF9745028.1 TATA-box-binding protein [Natrinema salsiterrestre]